MFNKTTLFSTLVGVGLALGAAVPSHAQQPGLVLTQTHIDPDFTATLTGLGTGGLVDILATDDDAAPGTQYVAGTLGFSGGQYQITNLTQDSSTITVPNAGGADITPQLNFESLLLTENFVGGATDTVTLYDDANIGSGAAPIPTTASDAFDFLGNGTVTDSNGNPIPLTGDLYGTPSATTGLESATLTGVFSDGGFTPAGQPVPVEIAYVPEPAPAALLALGLLPLAALGLRARRAR